MTASPKISFVESQTPPAEDFGYSRAFKRPISYTPKPCDLLTLARHMTREYKPGANNATTITTTRIPSGYTYLGQFIDHDISADSRTEFPIKRIPLASIVNNRTPFFDLESLYGKGPEDVVSKFLYEKDKAFLKLGCTVPDGSGRIKESFLTDLPRKPNSQEADILERRNDENLAIAQTHAAFIKFHNAVVRTLNANGDKKVFEEARKIVTLHYQWIVLHDFLPRIADPLIIDEVLNKGNLFYEPDRTKPQIPVEFSVAAYRLGHSMVRNSYEWNHFFRTGGLKGPANLSLLIEFTGHGGLGKKQNLISIWCIDWTRFYDFGNAPANHINFTSSIDTKISPQLGHLFSRIPDLNDPRASLPYASLMRSRAVGLTTGQSIAAVFGKHSGFPECTPDDIAELLPEDLVLTFAGSTPLWFYILAEAQIQRQGNSLGEVGSRLVAEVIITLMKLSPTSIFDKDGKITWRPFLEPQETPGDFKMTDLLRFVARHNTVFDELNPLKDYPKP